MMTSFKIENVHCRMLCKKRLESAASKTRAIKNMLTITNVKDRLRQAHEVLSDMEQYSNEVTE